MHCASCVARVEKALRTVEGVLGLALVIDEQSLHITSVVLYLEGGSVSVKVRLQHLALRIVRVDGAICGQRLFQRAVKAIANAREKLDSR